MKHLSEKTVREFQREVYAHYRESGRSFPWRDTHDSYRILVSEVMLQQTQAERVTVFFRRFVGRFPNVSALARAKTGEVIRLWQGLGYNRRALNLHKAAQIIVDEHKRRVPKGLVSLDALPGVGKYTAAAVLAFAFNQPSVFVETNIRTAYLSYFLKRKKKVSDDEILDLVRQTIDSENPREWYQALMDYGAMLKRTRGNENVRSRHYTKQSAFKGSIRQLRGGLLAQATERPLTPTLLRTYSRASQKPFKTVKDTADMLVCEGFFRRIRNSYHLA